MSFVPQQQTWKGDRAIVLIHGVGDYKKGDYNKLLDALKTAVGATLWDKTAVYTVFYDLLNDWVKEKTQAANLCKELVDRLKVHFETSDLGKVAAEAAGDVLWPVLELDARSAIRDAIIAQLQQAVLDGRRSGVRTRDQKIMIVAHSLGCFHTYEVLGTMAADPSYRMQPIADAVQFHSVVLMASPVQLIRSVAGWLGRLVPDSDDLFCLRHTRLELPGMINDAGRFVPSTRRFVSLTGNMDPVGGYLHGARLDWGYMSIVGQESVIDAQDAILPSKADLITALRAALADQKKGLPFRPGNPHDWVAYVERNAKAVKEWLAS